MKSEENEKASEKLRQAIRWIASQQGDRRRLIEEASLRFDLSPGDEEFLLRHFAESGD